MSKQVFYRYNAASEQYERVFPDRRARWSAMLRPYLVAIAVVAAVSVGLYHLAESPREKRLRQTNENLEQRLRVLNRQVDAALGVMDNIAERDNNFYRVMMQAEPLGPVQRYAGMERQQHFNSVDSLDDASLVNMVDSKLSRLNHMLVSQSRSFDFIAKELGGSKERIAHIPAIQPVPAKYMRTMASGYGVRRDPVYGTRAFHEGMDFSAPQGTPVYATADGTVTDAAYDGAYGNKVEINHGYNYTTRYAHLSKITAARGQKVKRGDLIGLVGNTGKSTGSHLHYEVRYRGAPQNPVNYYYFDITPAQYDEIIRMAENAGHVMD